MNQDTNRPAGEEDEVGPATARRVLLVEDDTLTRQVLREALQEWSFAPALAANLRQAREEVSTGTPFAVIVSDYHLPDGNGLEFHDWLKRDLRIEVPFLLISGGMAPAPSPGDEYEFLAKPFRLPEFRRRLERLSRGNSAPAAAGGLTAAQEALASVYARRRPPPDASAR